MLLTLGFNEIQFISVYRTGHGLVVYEKGLNTLAKEAVKAGTPVATIYRDLDGR